MRKAIIFFLFVNSALVAQTQRSYLDSLKNVLLNHSNDTTAILTLLNISNFYLYSKPDTAIKYAQQAADLSKEIKYTLGEGQANNIIGNIFYNTGNYVKALETQFSLLKIWRNTGDTFNMGASYNTIALVYGEQHDYRKALLYFLKAKQIFEVLHYNIYLVTVLLNIGDNYEKMNELDSALLYGNKAHALAVQLHDEDDIGLIFTNLGNIQYKLGNNKAASDYYKSGTVNALKIDDKITLSEAQYGIARVFKKEGQTDSSIAYAKQSLDAAIESSGSQNLDSISTFLSNLFESKRQTDSAFFYYKKAMDAKNTLSNSETTKRVEVMSTVEQLRQLLETKKTYHDKIKTYALTGGLIVLLLIAFILFRSNRHKQKANKQIEKAYGELKSTQAQLIQSEKMASLGELTAGIAHEIQNPLNFVNNFAEVNKEMIDELQAELNAGNIDEAINISNEIKDNEEKINHHGKRADAIVKNMLQHSRQSKGLKESADINELCDEYLRLSYHGLRAKDKTFNAIFTTDFDKSIDKINMVTQDIGRVLLNLFNNAFYALSAKALATADSNYQPTVSVKTKRLKDMIEIIVKDNGTGISKDIIDKIFQPFFTTKPTGQGTGLGLSLAYDIITKEHNGTIKVNSEPGNGSVFIIQLLLK